MKSELRRQAQNATMDSPDSHDATVDQPAPKGFLSLPQELRDHIYELALVKPRNTITMLSNYSCFQSEVSAAQPALARVNRQIRQETLPIFYSANLFLAELSDETDLDTAKRWLQAIGDENVKSLRRLVLCGWTEISLDHSMFTKRWIRVVLNLKSGTMEIEARERNDFKADERLEKLRSIGELRTSFLRLVEARAGEPFDVQSVTSLMDGFHGLCTLY
jgi:hypothetical protein